jgi:general secretion pathway protein G
MNQRIAKGFTLVEILIVVVILGSLAAIVVPQFTNASQDAIKSALASQIQTVNSQVELYRVQNAGSLPSADANPMLVAGAGTPTWNGWGVLVESDFLKNEPNNGYLRNSRVGAVWIGGANPATDGTVDGWAYNTTTGEVFANGYNNITNTLANEATYTDQAQVMP